MTTTSPTGPIQVLRTALDHASADGADAAAVAAFVGISSDDAQRLRRDLEQALRAIGRPDAADKLIAAALPGSQSDVSALMSIANSLQGVPAAELKSAISVPHMLARTSDQASRLWRIANDKHSGANGNLGNVQWLRKIGELDSQLQRAGLCPIETAGAIIAALHPAISALGASPYADGAPQLEQASRVLGPLLNVIELRLAETGHGPRYAIDSYYGDSPQIRFQHLARGWTDGIDATYFFINRNKTSARTWAAASPTHAAYIGLMDHLSQTLTTAVDNAPRA